MLALSGIKGLGIGKNAIILNLQKTFFRKTGPQFRFKLMMLKLMFTKSRNSKELLISRSESKNKSLCSSLRVSFTGKQNALRQVTNGKIKNVKGN